MWAEDPMETQLSTKKKIKNKPITIGNNPLNILFITIYSNIH